MKYLIISISLTLSCFINLQGQETQMILDGSIQIGNNSEASPVNGTIRWSGTDLEVWKDNTWISLTTGITSTGQLTDIDGNEYMTITIGTQRWMAENLRTSRYNDGTEIEHVSNLSTWNNLTTGAFSWYNNDNGFENVYGKLYNWHAADDPRGLCPTGWHVPTNSEVTTMTTFIGGDPVAGGKLKETGLEYWNSPNTAASDEYDFAGRPGGVKSTTFLAEGNSGYFLTATPSGSSAHFFILRYDQAPVVRSTTSKRSGCSIRCIEDN